MTAAHFIYIPVCILIGVVFGWILGGRAAKDAYLAELRRREERKQRTPNEEATESQRHRDTEQDRTKSST